MSTSGGAKSLTYNINPKGTTVSKVKAAKKGFKVTWKKQRTLTTGYQAQYTTNSKFKKAKTVTIGKNKTTSAYSPCTYPSNNAAGGHNRKNA